MEDCGRDGNAIHGAVVGIALSIPIWLALYWLLKWIF